MRSRAAFVVVAVLALGGCVGIPTSGGVQPGNVIGDPTDPQLEFGVAGPQPGADPLDILAGFMRAALGPQDGYAIAKQFLTEQFQAEWDPDAGVVIRSDTPSITVGADANTLLYSVTSAAVVDRDGRYTEPPAATQTLEFAFAEENGEIRISSAPHGIVLSQGSFASVFTKQALYFFDPSFRYLVPDVRWFPARPTVAVRIVRALLDGPAEWLTQGVLLSAFPIATKLATSETGSSVTIESATATVDFTTEALAASPLDRDRMRQQLSATLGTPTVLMTVGPSILTAPEPTGGGAMLRPTVESAALVGSPDGFGFDTSAGITAVDGLSEQIVATGATAVTLSNDKQSAVLLAADGGVYLATVNVAAQLLDSRPGLVAPTIDPFRYVWSAVASSAASLTTFEVDGTERELQSGLPPDASVVSMDLSRDGTRLLLYLSTPIGPRLLVAGVVREAATTPIGLGELIDLPTPEGAPIDATWVDDRTVATLSAAEGVTAITLFELGGPSFSIGPLQQGSSIAGGNGTDGIRVLNAGQVWRPQGSGGWVNTGVAASFIATKQ